MPDYARDLLLFAASAAVVNGLVRLWVYKPGHFPNELRYMKWRRARLIYGGMAAIGAVMLVGLLVLPL